MLLHTASITRGGARLRLAIALLASPFLCGAFCMQITESLNVMTGGTPLTCGIVTAPDGRKIDKGPCCGTLNYKVVDGVATGLCTESMAQADKDRDIFLAANKAFADLEAADKAAADKAAGEPVGKPIGGITTEQKVGVGALLIGIGALLLNQEEGSSPTATGTGR